MTEEQFYKIQKRHIELIKYIEGELGQEEQLDVIASEMEMMTSKALFAFVSNRFQIRKPLIDMHDKGTALLGIKSIIECFDEIEKK